MPPPPPVTVTPRRGNSRPPGARPPARGTPKLTPPVVSQPPIVRPAPLPGEDPAASPAVHQPAPSRPAILHQAPPEASARIAPKGKELPRPVPLTFGQPLSRPVRASRPLLPLAIAVVLFLGAVQVISTEAQSDMPLEQQLSERIAAVTSSGGTVATSSGVYKLGSGLPLVQPAMNVEAPDPSQLTTAPGSSATQPGIGPTVGVSAVLDASATPPDSSLCAPSGAWPYCTYVVQEGDTLWGIAELLGFAGNDYFSGSELLAMSNGLNDAQNWVIVPGQELRVPNATGIVHTVAEAETLSLLAEQYGTTTPDVILANPTLDPNNVITGSELLIPSPSLWPVSGPLTAEETAAEAEDADATEETGDAEADGAEGEEATSGEEATGEATEAPAEDGPPPTEGVPTGEGEGAESEAEEAATEEVAPAGVEATPEPESAPETESRPAANANPSVPEIRDQFAAGYIEAGGPPQYLENILNVVIPCESGYNLRAYNPRGPFYGLMQFLPETWANTGGGDWADAYQQGANTARLLHLKAANPRSQWPGCWGA